MIVQTPATKRNDPDTSYQAEQRMNKSGKRASQQRLVSELVEQFPGCTSAELARKAWQTGVDLDRPTLARRLPEVCIKGVSVKCRINKTMAVTWYPKDYPKNLLPQAE